MHRRFADIPRDKALATGVISAATVSNYFKPQSPRKRAGWPLAAAAEHAASVTHRADGRPTDQPTSRPAPHHSSCPLGMVAAPFHETFSPHHQQFMSEGEAAAAVTADSPQQPPAAARHTLGYAAQSKRRSICLLSTCRRHAK